MTVTPPDSAHELRTIRRLIVGVIVAVVVLIVAAVSVALYVDWRHGIDQDTACLQGVSSACE